MKNRETNETTEVAEKYSVYSKRVAGVHYLEGTEGRRSHVF
jgi:hypothetical protein